MTPSSGDDHDKLAGRSDGAEGRGHTPFGPGGPLQILQRLLADDSIELRERCSERLSREALLLAPERLYLRALARTAHAAPHYDGSPVLDIWLADRIRVSLRELVEEDREAERRDLPLEAPDSFSPLLAAWGVEPHLVRRASVAFNSQPYFVRQAFYELILERKSLAQFVAEGNGPAEQVRKRFRRAVRALGLDPENGVPEAEGGVADG